jgi:very-short-patch-repair endonuclease
MDCDKCKNTFEITLGHASGGNWCSFCKHKTECKLYEKIKPIYPSIISQFKEEWCIKIYKLRFDFCIPDNKIIIELDGRQHFQQVQNWSSPEEQFDNDLYKQQCANDNEYSVIRILQQDVWNDAYDWCKELCDTIEEINTLGTVTNRYLCKNSEYDRFNL